MEIRKTLETNTPLFCQNLAARFVELTPDMVVMLRPAGEVVYSNPAWTQRMGWVQAEIIGKDWHAFVHTDDVPGTDAVIARLTAGIDVRFSQNRCRRADGTYRTVRWSATYSPAEGMILASGRDVTDLDRVALSAENSLGHLTSALKGASCVVALTDVNLRYQWIFSPHPDFDPMAIIGRTDLELDSNDGVLALTELKTKVIETGEITAREISFPLSTGITTFRVTAAPCRDTSGNVSGVLTVSFLVEPAVASGGSVPREGASADSASEKGDLRDRIENLERVLDIVPAAVWIAMDPECRNIVGNARANELHDVRKGENVSATVRPTDWRYFSADGKELKPEDLPMQQAVARNTSIDEAFLWLELSPGRRVAIRGSAVPLRDQDGKVRGGVFACQDVTAQACAEDALLTKAKDLEQFAYVVSHDLQEPLRKVGNYLDLLSRDLAVEKGSAATYVAKALESASRMRSLISDLLAYSRLDRPIRVEETVDLQVVVREAIEDLSVATEASGAVIEVGDLPPVLGVRPHLHQLFQNLIGNAVKYNVQAPPRISISAEAADGHWLISVRDNGIGIEPIYHERIFGLFQRLQRKSAYEGNGVGLAVCRRIVERHGGRIWVESAPGEGSTFKFLLKRSE